jgi:predicted RNA-binding protein associated with RNAse of E/G family
MDRKLDLDLERITEIKESLRGGRKTFNCKVLARRGGELVVLFVSTAVYSVLDLSLPVGTVTFGHFWTDRPYNVYHWMEPSGRTIAFYVNLAADTKVDGGQLSWRDLVVDVLVVPGAAPLVLDEDELPPDLDAATQAAIAAARAEVLARLPALTTELASEADALWPRAFGTDRQR